MSIDLSINESQSVSPSVQVGADVVYLEIDLSKPRRVEVVGRDGNREVKREIVVTENRRLEWGQRSRE